MSENKKTLETNPDNPKKNSKNNKRKPNKISDYQVGDLSTEIEQIDSNSENVTKINLYTGL